MSRKFGEPILYKVRFSPGGEEYFIEAMGAVNAHQRGMGQAALDGVRYNGVDVMHATENEITDYYGDEEE